MGLIGNRPYQFDDTLFGQFFRHDITLLNLLFARIFDGHYEALRHIRNAFTQPNVVIDPIFLQVDDLMTNLIQHCCILQISQSVDEDDER
jgi:indole-3-glycerol phosphate synthase